MTESEFLDLADNTLEVIERLLEEATNRDEVDVECSRSGNVLDIELIETGTKIIINSQAAMQEIWVAAKSGGFHYKHVNGHWTDTRSGEELFSALSRMLSEQTGSVISLSKAS